jgi:hypothetical protein
MFVSKFLLIALYILSSPFDSYELAMQYYNGCGINDGYPTIHGLWPQWSDYVSLYSSFSICTYIIFNLFVYSLSARRRPLMSLK